MPAYKMNEQMQLSRDAGFTIFEALAVIVITSILASVLGQVLISAIEISVDHNLRTTAHIDSRRALEMISRDLREWKSQNALSANTIDFQKTIVLLKPVGHDNKYYYGDVRTGYSFDSGRLTFQQDISETWNNQYYVIDSGVLMGSSRFTQTVAGTKTRYGVELLLTVNRQPMRYRTTVFPRVQGG